MILTITFLSSLRLFSGVAAAGAVLALMAVALAGSVAGGLFVLSKVGDRRR